MVLYTCDNCKKVFNKKSNYLNHIEKKKNPCKANNIIIIDNPSIIHNNTPKNDIFEENIHQKSTKKKHCCNFCQELFCRSDVLKKHLQRCKIRKEENKEKEELIQLLLQQNEKITILIEDNKKLNDKIDKIENNITTTNNTSNTNTNNTSNTNSNNTNTNTVNSNNKIINNIKIEFGKEDLKKLDKSVFYNALLRGSGAEIPSKIIEGMHFNDNNKDFQNVYISDLSRNKALIHNGKDWNIANADEIVDKLFDKSLIYAGTKNEELEDEIADKPKTVKNKIHKEIKLMNLMKGKEEFEVDDDGNHIDIDGKIVSITEFKRGERLNVRAKDKIKLTLCNKKIITKNNI